MSEYTDTCPWCGAELVLPPAGSRDCKTILRCPECGGVLPPIS